MMPSLQEKEVNLKSPFIVAREFSGGGRTHRVGEVFDVNGVAERRVKQLVLARYLRQDDSTEEKKIVPVQVKKIVKEPESEIKVETKPEPEISVEGIPAKQRRGRPKGKK